MSPGKLDISMANMSFVGMAMTPRRTRIEELEEICISGNLALNLEGIQLTIDWGLVPLTMESDALGVVKNVDIIFVPSRYNTVAHSAARFALR
ncbi:hypothetical protein QYF36_009554 [Acer negundo]|nr:hypothetical protein QYF36_009554 [Acer negundo]